MKVINDNLLALVRCRRCEWCGKPGPSHAHHVFSKGMGGWGRMDVPINLVALCAVCHAKHHDGNAPTRRQLLILVAVRESTLPHKITQELYELRRRPDGECRETVLDDPLGG